jgi:hypothetical protein
MDFDFSKIKHRQFVIMIVALFGVLVSPLWLLYQFAFQIFQRTDLVKLIFLALGIGLPISLLFSFFLILLLFIDNDPWAMNPTNSAIDFIFLMGCLFAGMFLYYPSFIFFTQNPDHKYTLKEAIAISQKTALWTSIGLVIVSIIKRVYRHYFGT